MVNYNRKIVRRVLSFIGLVILGIFIYTLDLDSIISSQLNLSLPMILTVLTITASQILIKSFRWKELIYRISKQKISLGFSFLSVIAAVASGSITPGRIELAKPIMLKERNNVPISVSLSVVFMERICDFFALLLMMLISLFFMPSQNIINNSVIFTALIILFIMTLLLVLFPQKNNFLIKTIVNKTPFSEKIKEKINNFCEQFFSTFSILKNKNLLSFTLVFSTLAIILEALQFYLILRFFGVDIGLALSAFVLSSTTVLGVISMIPGGTGVIEISSIAILMNFFPESGIAIQSSVLLNRIICYYLLIFLGALIMIFYKKIELKNHNILK